MSPTIHGSTAAAPPLGERQQLIAAQYYTDMSFNNRSYRAGKYGEDHSGGPTPKRGFSSTLRPGNGGFARGVAVQHPNNTYNVSSNASPPDLASSSISSPPSVLPDMDDWVDDVSALTGLTGLTRGRSIPDFHIDENDEAHQNAIKNSSPTYRQGHQRRDGGEGFYPDVSTLHSVPSRLAAVALADYVDHESQALDEETEEEALKELEKLSDELNMDNSIKHRRRHYQDDDEDQGTGTTAGEESGATPRDESTDKPLKPPRDPRIKKKKKKSSEERDSKSSRDGSDSKEKKKKSSSKKKKSSSSSKIKKEKSTTSALQSHLMNSISLRDKVPSNIDDETLAQLTNAVLEAVTVISASSQDKESADGSSRGKKKSKKSSSKTKKRASKKPTVQQQPQEEVPLQVGFSTVEIRQYERILSDNPSCTSGPSVGIGWLYNPTDTLHLSVERFENHRQTSRAPIVPILTRGEREEMLMELGYTRQELATAVRNSNKVRNKRRQTVTNLYAQKAEERAESTKRFIKKAFSIKSSSSSSSSKDGKGSV